MLSDKIRKEIANKTKKIDSLIEKISYKDEEIRVMKETLELIIENSTEGFWDWRIKEDKEYLSPQFKKILGYEDDEMVNHPSSWQKLIVEEDLAKLFEKYEEHEKSKGVIPFESECRYTHKDGHIILIWCKGKIVEWDDDGSAKRMVGTHIDITNLRK